MAICHVVRCDGPGCQGEIPMEVIEDGMRGSPFYPIYYVPKDWFQVSDRQFCSWPCVGKFAMSQSGDE